MARTLGGAGREAPGSTFLSDYHPSQKQSFATGTNGSASERSPTVADRPRAAGRSLSRVPPKRSLAAPGNSANRSVSMG
jgi:hypothetical protein